MYRETAVLLKNMLTTNIVSIKKYNGGLQLVYSNGVTLYVVEHNTTTFAIHYKKDSYKVGKYDNKALSDIASKLDLHGRQELPKFDSIYKFIYFYIALGVKPEDELVFNIFVKATGDKGRRVTMDIIADGEHILYVTNFDITGLNSKGVLKKDLTKKEAILIEELGYGNTKEFNNFYTKGVILNLLRGVGYDYHRIRIKRSLTGFDVDLFGAGRTLSVIVKQASIYTYNTYMVSICTDDKYNLNDLCLVDGSYENFERKLPTIIEQKPNNLISKLIYTILDYSLNKGLESFEIDACDIKIIVNDTEYIVEVHKEGTKYYVTIKGLVDKLPII